MPELSAAIGVSQRTLEYAFESVFDLTPLAYLRMLRLHTARRRLMSTDRAQCSVTQVAYDVGFWHMPRFAAAYKAQFGELPSATNRNTREGHRSSTAAVPHRARAGRIRLTA